MGKSPVAQEKSSNPEGVAEAPACRHHWIIETPRGATSMGRCKRCGQEREFRNSASDYLWEDESGSGYNAWRGSRSVPKTVADDDDVSAEPRLGTPLMV